MELVIETAGLVLFLMLWLEALVSPVQRAWRLAEARLFCAGFGLGLSGLLWQIPALDQLGLALVLLASAVAAARAACLCRWHWRRRPSATGS